MFGNLRKKLNNAIQDGFIITENLQQQYRQRQASSTGSSATTPTLDDSIPSNRSSHSFGQVSLNDVILPADLNMAAGCNLLAKYEDDWRILHVANEENASKASQVAEQIEQIGQRTSALHVDMTDLITCLSGIPALVEKLSESAKTLQKVDALSASVEMELERLQDLCEECDLQEYMLNKQCELSQFKQMKMIELESYRRRVAAEHQDKIRQHEQQLRRIQRERQAVFDDAFRGDLAEFKTKGTITKIQTETLPQSVALEEVVLEDPTTKDALEDFLNG
ncbi:dysbindin protein homolog [Rhagoletis pomonella]|uniref:dysbindin protein homolog n=1 Tax=Rhagoletis pomonella TaxID=28610 RepID=UPI00177D0A3F|nr:dysbindin protein homolog [Rhagoletis pomonella]